MKFSELNPKITGAMLPGVMDISIDCARCGPPYRVQFYATREVRYQATAIWLISSADDFTSYDGLTITPSVSNHHHGKKKSCDWHFTVTNGDVV